MEKIIYWCFLLLNFIGGSLFISCANSDAELLTDRSTQSKEEYSMMIKRHEETRLNLERKRAANMILGEYLRLDGNKYVLEISEKEALELGVPKEFYVSAKYEVEEVNKVIDATLRKKGKLRLFDIQKRAKEYNRGINRDPINSSESFSLIRGSVGTLFPIGNEPVETTFIVDGNTVEFRCRTAAALVVAFVCRVCVNGITNHETCAGSVFCTRTIDVRIPGHMSGDHGIIGFSTTDANGGSCYWRVH